jgi:hypothetical protein
MYKQKGEATAPAPVGSKAESSCVQTAGLHRRAFEKNACTIAVTNLQRVCCFLQSAGEEGREEKKERNVRTPNLILF